MVRSALPPLIAGLHLGALLAGCSPSWYVRDADREVDGILQEFDQRALAGREEWVEYPVFAPKAPSEPRGSTPKTSEMPTEGAAPARPLQLASALALAVTSNRGYLSQRESLYLSGLSYSLTLYNFGLQYRSAIAYLFNVSEDGPRSSSIGGNFDIQSPLLPTGGRAALSTNASRSRTEGADENYNSSVNLSINQPLLRGAGYEVSHEGLTQAERSMIYAIRDFENFREDFSISIAQSYFNLVSQQRRLANSSQDLEEAVFDRKKSEQLLSAERADRDQVTRAKRREIEAQNQLVEDQESFSQNVDRFKIELGLPTSEQIEIVEEDPPYEPVELDWGSCVKVALHNNLDLITSRERLEDSERSLRIARNGLLPDVNLNLSSGLDGSDNTFLKAEPEAWSASAGLSFEIPLQQVSERNNYRATLISFEQAKRGFQEDLDNLERVVLDQLRNLRRLELQNDLQLEQIEQEEVAVRLNEVRYEAAGGDNRNLLEARQSLLNAKNELIQIRVDHFLGRLQLLKTLGILFIDEQGMWK